MSLAYPDGRCALPAAPHRTRTAVHAVGSALGQAHWPTPQASATSGRWPTVLGVTHPIACAQVGPIRTPGGPPNPGGRVIHQRLLRALASPAPPRLLRCWSLPPCFLPQGRPSFPRPLPCFLVPAVSRLPLLSAPALAHWCLLIFFFRSSLVPPPGVSVCTLPPPTSPRCLLAVFAPFVGGWRSRGWGGGASSLPVPWREHVASTVQARGAALVPLQVGGGGVSRVAYVVALPILRLHSRWSPCWGLHGACFLWARSCGPSRTLSPLPPRPAALSSGGGPRSATVIPLVALVVFPL